ncbi:MAG TPA: hypothetical protein VF818_06345 [Ktedonobacterales bacterium]
MDNRLRMALLALAVVAEGFAVLSATLHISFLVPSTIYPNFISVTVVILPVIIGLLSQRLEGAIVFSVLPFFVLGVVYATLKAPVWNQDLFSIGVLAGRVASSLFLLGGLGIFGWMLQRLVWGGKAAFKLK